MEEFSKLCHRLRSASGHKDRSKVLSDFIHRDEFRGDVELLLRLLLPKDIKRVYNIKDKQLVNLFTQLLNIDKEEMLEELNKAEDPAVMIGGFYKSSNSSLKPAPKSILTLLQVDQFLDKLADVSKESDRLSLLEPIVKKCTVRDLSSLIQLIRQDLRLNAGCKQILDGLHPQAYVAFQASRDLKAVVAKVMNSDPTGDVSTKTVTKKSALSRDLSTGIRLMTPIKPMLADACRSATAALAKAKPSGQLLTEIKYDGERVQIHKDGDRFSYYSRSLKTVPANKVSHIEPYIPQAFVRANQLVIDCEILLLDTNSGKPLPFGSLGVHKSTYEPGKRHWLKIKRDYLAEGVMADSVDLIVLGAYYGTGTKAGIMSVFLMGAYDEASRQFSTVTKCGNGYTDDMLIELNKTLKTTKVIKSDVPLWLNVARALTPDFVVQDPKNSPVWEITGAEFSRASTHTAGLSGTETQGISIRFPRFTKARPDKSWREATSVKDLERLVSTSGQRSDWLDVLTDVSAGSKRDAPVESGSSPNTPKKPRVSEKVNNKPVNSANPRHLTSLFAGKIFTIAESLKDSSELRPVLRRLIACKAELTGDMDEEFKVFSTTSDATHIIVPDGYDKNSKETQLTMKKITQIVQGKASLD